MPPSSMNRLLRPTSSTAASGRIPSWKACRRGFQSSGRRSENLTLPGEVITRLFSKKSRRSRLAGDLKASKVVLDELEYRFDFAFDSGLHWCKRRAVIISGRGPGSIGAAVIGIYRLAPDFRVVGPFLPVDQGGFSEPDVPGQSIPRRQQVPGIDVEEIHDHGVEGVRDRILG